MMNPFKRSTALILLSLYFCVLLTGCNETIDARQLDTVQGLKYKLHDSEPFTGTVINLPKYGDTVMNCTAEFVKGELHGSFICAARNGVTVLKATYKNNLKHGVEKIWNSKTENLYSKTEWKNNRKHGWEEIYNPNGTLIEQRHWHTGNKDGEDKVWDAEGAELLLHLSWVDGKKTGFCKCLNIEENYQDGQLHGTRNIYQQQAYASFNEGKKKHTEWLANKQDGLYWLGSENTYYLAVEEIYENGELISKKEFTDPSKPKSNYK